MSTVRWGIMSTSRHAANAIIPAIRQAGNGEIVAVASRDADRSREYADAHHIPASYGDYESLLADPDVDAIYNPLPNNLHKEWSIRAAQAGKHVLCEKPLAMNAAEAVDMMVAFRTAGLRLAEAFQWRHHPQGQHMLELVRQGAIGEMRLVIGGFTFMLDRPDDIRWVPELGGGALYDVGCYPISFCRFITGQEPISVTAHAHWHKAGIDDMVVATMEFPDGVLAHINCGFSAPLRRYYEVVGTEGSLEVNRAYNPFGDHPDTIVQYGLDREVIRTIPLSAVNSYMLMVKDFNAAVLEDRDPLFSSEDAIAQMRVIDAIFEAARNGKAVTIKSS